MARVRGAHGPMALRQVIDPARKLVRDSRARSPCWGPSRPGRCFALLKRRRRKITTPGAGLQRSRPMKIAMVHLAVDLSVCAAVAVSLVELDRQWQAHEAGRRRAGGGRWALHGFGFQLADSLLQ